MKKAYNLMLLLSILTLAVIASASTMRTASAQTYPGPYYAVEPSQTTMGPSPAIGQTFTVNLTLHNVTHTNIPAGIQGIEIHLTWNNTLIEPVSSTSKVGLTGGVLTGPSILYALSPGFYDNQDNMIASAPYTNATHFEVAAASTVGPWWGDGTIAQITFQVDEQPLPFATCPIAFDFSALRDANAVATTHSRANATYTIFGTAYETVTYNGVDYPVTIVSDSTITAPSSLGFNVTAKSITFNVTATGGFCNVTIPKALLSSTVDESNWTITVDGSPVTSSNEVITDNSTHAFLWFNFTAGYRVITISATQVIPEFAATNLILFLMATTLIVTATATSLRRRKFHY